MIAPYTSLLADPEVRAAMEAAARDRAAALAMCGCRYCESDRTGAQPISGTAMCRFDVALAAIAAARARGDSAGYLRGRAIGLRMRELGYDGERLERCLSEGHYNGNTMRCHLRLGHDGGCERAAGVRA